MVQDLITLIVHKWSLYFETTMLVYLRISNLVICCEFGFSTRQMISCYQPQLPTKSYQEWDLVDKHHINGQCY